MRSDQSLVPNSQSLLEIIRKRGPLTVAAFMELALYHPELGYYARAGQRSGRAGDFFTSVDVGPIFGELLAAQIAEMAAVLQTSDFRLQTFDLVEAGAGNGRLSADILRALQRDRAATFERVRLHLVEASGAARADQARILGDLAERVASTGPSLPAAFEGVLIANELLDAMPVHQVTMSAEALKELYVTVDSSQSTADTVSTVNWKLSTVAGPPSTPRLSEYFTRLGITLDVGWRAEVNLRAVKWVEDAARRLRRGFMILIDYGHDARELYSASHSAGTLTSFSGHRAGDGGDWLQRPGEQDITSHVDWTSVRAAAEASGLETIAFLDQTYFLLGLLPSVPNPQSSIRHLKTLLMPGALGSTMKVLILGKGVGRPPLLGTSFKIRAT